MLAIHTNGILKKAAQILSKDILPSHKSRQDWDKVKADLEGLSKTQLDLVLRLIEQMKRVNKEHPQEGQS